jgi:hypothetical protein
MEAKKKVVLSTEEDITAIVVNAVEAVLRYTPVTQPALTDPEAILTASQAAELLQVSLPTFRSWDRKGLVQRRLIGGEVRYLRSEIIASLKLPEVKRTAGRRKSTPKPAVAQ